MSIQLGKKLSAHRRRRGLSVDDVGFETKIHSDIIRNIEKSEFSKIGNLTYAKSFITIYADFLGVDISKELKELSSNNHELNSNETKPINVNLEHSELELFRKQNNSPESKQSTVAVISHPPMLMWLILIAIFFSIGIGIYLYAKSFVNKSVRKNPSNNQLIKTTITQKKQNEIDLTQKIKKAEEENLLKKKEENETDPINQKTHTEEKNLKNKKTQKLQIKHAKKNSSFSTRKKKSTIKKITNKDLERYLRKEKSKTYKAKPYYYNARKYNQ